MRHAVQGWFMLHRRSLLWGLACWLLIGLAAAGYAAVTARPLLPTIVTWDEWFAALLLLPMLWTAGRKLYPVALVVFALGLLARALFGLGWEPFH